MRFIFFLKSSLSDDKIQIKYLHQRRNYLHIFQTIFIFPIKLRNSDTHSFFLKMKNTKKCMNKRNTRNEKFYNNNIIIIIIIKECRAENSRSCLAQKQPPA